MLNSHMVATLVVDGVYLGAEDDIPTSAWYTLVVNCTPDLPFAADVPVSARIRIPVKDNGDPEQQVVMAEALVHGGVLQRMWSELNESGGDARVLVHCRMGQQRSAAVVAAYLTFSRGGEEDAEEMTIDEAVRRVRERRPEAFLGGHVNFLAALQQVVDVYLD